MFFKAFAGRKPWQGIRGRMKEPSWYERTDHFYKVKAKQQKSDA